MIYQLSSSERSFGNAIVFLFRAWITDSVFAIIHLFYAKNFFRFDQLIKIASNVLASLGKDWNGFCLRPYHVECSRSRSISEDKLRRARSVLRWVTAWEHRVLQAFFQFFFDYRKSAASSCGRTRILPCCIMTAHTAAATVQWIENFGYFFISVRDWLANSPDLSPMDYSVNGIFKRRLWKRKARSVKRLKRAMRQGRSKVSVDLFVETLFAWEFRVKLMLQSHGLQRKHLKSSFLFIFSGGKNGLKSGTQFLYDKLCQE